MILIAIRMIMGDRLKFAGLLVGITFAAMLITQQASIFMGYSRRMTSFIDDTPHADIFVMDPDVEFTEDPKAMRETILQRVRSVPGVSWAVPMYRGQLLVQIPSGKRAFSVVIGVDDSTLLGAPIEMIEGDVNALREGDGVVVDLAATKGDFAVTLPDGSKRPLQVGDQLAINDRFARVVGICKTNEAFYWAPVLYTTYSRAVSFAPEQRKQLTFVLAGVDDKSKIDEVAADIHAATDMAARTRKDFSSLTRNYTLIKTGILVNFGITVGLGFIIGLLVCGQTFFNFVVDNTRYFGALKALGLTNLRLIAMIITQSLVVGSLGFGLGAGLASISGTLMTKVGVGFYMPWQLLVASCVSVMLICVVSACLPMIRVLRLEPAVVFKS
ncbi:MAG: ABC transporter permease [Phycisphaerales bacterium]